MGIEAPQEPKCVCTPEGRNFYMACVAQWAFGEVLNTIDDYRDQECNWHDVARRTKAHRDIFRRQIPTSYPLQPEPIAEYIPSISLSHTSNGNLNRIKKCAAILNDPQHAEYHGAIRRAQVMLTEKRPLPPDLANKVERLYSICAD
jgi:hypothetical protein